MSTSAEQPQSVDTSTIIVGESSLSGVSDERGNQPAADENGLVYVNRRPKSRYCEDRLGSLLERDGEEEAKAYLAIHASTNRLTRIHLAKCIGSSGITRLIVV